MVKPVGFSAISSHQAIDAAAGIIRGVSVITVGEALGHNLWVDTKTLNQVVALAGDSLKVKVNHPKKGDNAAFESTAGKLTKFRVDGDRVRADLELLTAEELFDKILEMAQKMPEDFGLSIRVQYETEEIDKRDFLRPIAIESVDLVDSPAANPNGLFSAKTAEPTQKTRMNQVAKALGLAETATETEVMAELAKRLEKKPEPKPEPNPEIAGLQTKLAELTTKVAELGTKATEAETKAKEAALAAKKTEITSLVAEASASGKVVPLTEAQLEAMEIPVIKEMIAKLPKAQVQLAKRVELPAKDGKMLSGADLVEFCRAKRAEGEAALTAKFASLN